MNYLDCINENEIDKQFFEMNRIKVDNIDDIFKGAGKILKASQEWEYKFKRLCEKFEIELKDNSSSTLGAMNKKLLENEIIEQKEFETLNKVITIRNEFTHKYFLDNSSFGKWSYPLEEVSNKLTAILYLINESNDWISNKIDDGFRPNLLNKINKK